MRFIHIYKLYGNSAMVIPYEIGELLSIGNGNIEMVKEVI